ncbi:hypothetical protein CANMA_000671 [Candida margitis]|uniref:uncharacterized protein n=1 Tax=Candida margitis TaxID=1775924 RepID=UPI002225DA61|nr:uncharacterized protein CANMA_000671 [Candida margitis]KAI5970318.1 hypothetical protein CANMA_000671 [Candida margitis]
MWPHKSGLGVRLGYGVFGNPNVEVESVTNTDTLSNDGLQPKINFPRKEGDAEESKYLCEVSYKDLIKKPLNHSVGEVYKSEDTSTSFRSDEGYFATDSVPYKIISSFGLETKAMDSDVAYDPCFGDIVQTFQIKPKSQDALVHGLIHVTGEALSVLSLSIRLQDGVSIKLSHPYEVDFLDQIRQVEVGENEAHDRLIILVRTRVKVYATTCKLENYSTNSKSAPDFKLSIIKEIASQKLDQSTFANVAVCASDVRKFAMIDVNGNLTAWLINKKYDKVSRMGDHDVQIPIADASNLSHWLRLTWLSNLNSILLSTRTKIFQYDFVSMTQKVLVTSNTWSRIRDVQCVGDMIFSLTSKELIWLQRRGTEIERLLSWRHFLNDNDPSLKFSVLTRHNSYLVFLYSQANPLVLVYTLGFDHGRPSSLRDPYIVQRSNAVDLKQLVPLAMDDADNIIVIELSSSLHLRQRRLEFKPLAQPPSTLEGCSYSGENTTKNHKHKHNHLKKLHAVLVQSVLKEEDQGESVAAIQKYASLLDATFETNAEKQKFSLGNYRSLLEIDYRVPLGISDLAELDDMIAEFENSPLTEDLSIRSFINTAIIQRNGFLDIPDAQTHIFNIHALLEQIFAKCNVAGSITNTSILLGLSLIKCQAQQNQFQSKYEAQKAASPAYVQEILDEWDTPAASQPVEQQPSSQLFDASQTVPLLKSSQIEPMAPPRLSQSSHSQFGGSSNFVKGSGHSQPASQHRSQSRLGDTLRISSQLSILELRDGCPDKVSSVKVITRSIKPSGRYMKTFTELAASEFAIKHDIPILRADSSKDILALTSSNNFNLTIAVSYGKLIPAAFLSSCKYGGLNVHPSLLPRYSGSSPIQYALLNDDKTTGVTVQSLHPTKFDHGSIIAQSNDIKINDTDDYDSLSDRLAQEGGSLLQGVIDRGLFLNTSLPNTYERSLAPKIDKSKSQALWSIYTSRQIKRLYDALGPVYTFLNTKTKKKGQVVEEKKRVILGSVTDLISPPMSAESHHLQQPGDFILLKEGLCVKCKKGYVLVQKIKLQTRGDESPEKFIGSYHKTVGDMPQHFIS